MAVVSTESLRRFVTGQLEIQRHGENHSRRGEIKSATVVGIGNRARLHVEFEWVARGESTPRRWSKYNNSKYEVLLLRFGAQQLSQGRLALSSTEERTTLHFYPPNYPNNLDRKDVQGL